MTRKSLHSQLYCLTVPPTYYTGGQFNFHTEKNQRIFDGICDMKITKFIIVVPASCGYEALQKMTGAILKCEIYVPNPHRGYLKNINLILRTFMLNECSSACDDDNSFANWIDNAEVAIKDDITELFCRHQDTYNFNMCPEYIQKRYGDMINESDTVAYIEADNA